MPPVASISISCLFSADAGTLPLAERRYSQVYSEDAINGLPHSSVEVALFADGSAPKLTKSVRGHNNPAPDWPMLVGDPLETNAYELLSRDDQETGAFGHAVTCAGLGALSSVGLGAAAPVAAAIPVVGPAVAAGMAAVAGAKLIVSGLAGFGGYCSQAQTAKNARQAFADAALMSAYIDKRLNGRNVTVQDSDAAYRAVDRRRHDTSENMQGFNNALVAEFEQTVEMVSNNAPNRSLALIATGNGRGGWFGYRGNAGSGYDPTRPPAYDAAR